MFTYRSVVVYWCNNATICRRKKKGEKKEKKRSCRNDGLKRSDANERKERIRKREEEGEKDEIKRSF